jgi:hypothetical protein
MHTGTCRWHYDHWSNLLLHLALEAMLALKLASACRMLPGSMPSCMVASTHTWHVELDLVLAHVSFTWLMTFPFRILGVSAYETYPAYH